MLAALGRLIARAPVRFVAAWAVLVVAGLAAASGAFGEGLFGRLQPGDAPQVNSEARTGQQLLAASPPGGSHRAAAARPCRPCVARRPGGGRG